MTVTCTGDDAPLAAAVLGATSTTGVRLAVNDLPRVPVEFLGGKLLGRVGRLHLCVMVGQEWRKGATHRVYGTLIDPDAATYSLGYVDLATGHLHPSVEGKLAKDRGTAEGHLRILRDERPQVPTG